MALDVTFLNLRLVKVPDVTQPDTLSCEWHLLLTKSRPDLPEASSAIGELEKTSSQNDLSSSALGITVL